MQQMLQGSRATLMKWSEPEKQETTHVYYYVAEQKRCDCHEDVVAFWTLKAKWRGACNFYDQQQDMQQKRPSAW